MKRKQSEPAADAPASPPPKRPVGRPRKDATKPPPKKKASAAGPQAKPAPASTRATRNTAPTPSTSSTITTASSSESEALPNAIEIDSDSDLTSLDHEILDGAEFDAATIGMLGRGDEEHGDKEEEDDEEDSGGDDEEEGEEDPEPEAADFDLEFVIPVSTNAADTLYFSSDGTFTDFTQRIADEMDVRRKDLKIGYKFSHWAKDILPRILATPMHLLRLFNTAREELETRAKSKSAAARKPLQVTIINLSAKNQEKPESKKGGKKPKSKSKTPKPVASSDEEDKESRTKNKSGAQYLRELEAAHKCEKHGGFCVVAKNGEHLALSTNNLSLWSLLRAQGAHDSNTIPPAVLNLAFETGTQAPPASRRQIVQNLPPPPPPGPPGYPYYHPAGPYPYAYYPPPPAPPAAAVPAPESTKAAADDSEDDETPTLFPKIDEWLSELDTSERGEDGHHFTQFGPLLRAQGFMRLVQLTEMGADGETMLQGICAGMTLGVAKLVLKYARVDCKKIRKTEAARKAAGPGVV
ncbi:hypothetical protein C8R46DRAFT_1184375 [Mycena filopes]|nr:hypothetical protein C8R46DRAFT_1184375 [Mycena filopes]